MTGIKIGGAYKESDDFTPNPADMRAQFNTSGLGASNRIEDVSAVFDVDKVQVAKEITSALDPDDDSVSSSRVLLPETEKDNKAATEEITKIAKARIKKGVVIGGPTDSALAAQDEDKRSKSEAKKDEEAAKQPSTTSTAGSTPEVGNADVTVTPTQPKGNSTKK